MTPLQKEIEAFEKEKLGYLDWCGNEDHECECSVKEDEIKSFLRQSLLRFTRSVIEKAMPEEKKENLEYDTSDPVQMRNRGIEFGHNTCRAQLKENIERILKDNE